MNAEAVEHLYDLRKLKNVDYEFYKYLEEHGKDLLNPVDFVDEIDSKDENKYLDEDEPENEVNLPRLTWNEFSKIKNNIFSTKSIESLNFLLTCFKSVANINTFDDESVPTKKSLEQSKKVENKSRRPEKGLKKERVADFHIEEPELMFEIVQFTLDNIPILFWFHSSNWKPKEELSPSILPTDLPKWKNIEKICNTFWQDLGNLILYNCLKSNPSFELMEYVFDRLSDRKFIMWLLPNRMSTIRFTTLLSRIWTMNKYLVLKKGSFNVLRTINTSFESLCSSENENKHNHHEFRFTEKNDLLNNPVKRHEDFLLLLHRIIGVSALRGVSWKNYTSNRQIVDEYVTLLTESDSKKVYRIAYNVIRNLGSLLRLLFIRLSRKSKLSKQMVSKKKEKNSSLEEIYSSIYSWKFLTFIRIWTKAIASIPYLTPLQYPTTVIITSTIRVKLNSVPLLPFTLQCIEMLVEMASKMRTLVPIAEMLFEAHNTIEKGVKESYVKFKQDSVKSTNMINTTSKIFVPEFEIKIGNQLLKSTQVFDSIQEYWTHIIVLHISGFRNLHFFPEFLIFILQTLKKLQKHNSKHWNDQVLSKTKEILKLAQKHSEHVSTERTSVETNSEYIELLFESLDPVKDKSTKKSYNTLSYIYPKLESSHRLLSKNTCDDPLTQFMNDEIDKRAEFLNTRIKLSSLKLSNQSNVDLGIPICDQTSQQDDLEFVSLLQQLNKVGKTIDDLNNIGPRQLKKLKKSIKNNILTNNSNKTIKTMPNNNPYYHTNPISNINKNKSFSNLRCSNNKMTVKPLETDGNNASTNLREATNSKYENLKKLKINPKDSIQEWNLTLSDSDN
ncbi:hypothetical protein RS030_122012 [Cryptosporidium xiaoi]|uniref:Uncharacterized protein n=1 Tax=Cryptosporidium xiaoi TaxID=659607 RepID=A0AAV9YAD8_9CRYT